MKHDVHLHVSVRVKIPGVEAENHNEAIAIAENSIDLHSLFNRNIGGYECAYNEEISGFTVDEEGDTDFFHTRDYDADHLPVAVEADSIDGHKLIIHSLHDAQAECSCGRWAYVSTGEKSRAEVTRQWSMHVKSSS